MKYLTMNRITILGLVLAICCLLRQIDAHGMMLDPVGRSSRWRYDTSAPRNYDDNALYCGGLWKLVANNACGLCGDDYSFSVPRPNEIGGKFGSGVIVRSYIGASSADINVLLTVNHLGHFSFHLCSLDEFGKESEECFNKYPLAFADGSLKYNIGSAAGSYDMTVQLPKGLSCKHCVLRWTYTAGNNWGTDQETFKNCADVSILGSTRQLFDSSIEAEVPVLVDEAAGESSVKF